MSSPIRHLRSRALASTMVGFLVTIFFFLADVSAWALGFHGKLPNASSIKHSIGNSPWPIAGSFAFHSVLCVCTALFELFPLVTVLRTIL
jgi:hypothetical protein